MTGPVETGSGRHRAPAGSDNGEPAAGSDDPQPGGPTVGADGDSAAHAEAFGPRAHLAMRYAAWLTGAATLRGLIGPREAAQVWNRHILNSVALSTLIEPNTAVLDLGSGAGLPGIPLALARPDLTVVLVEPKQRRVDFLTEVVADLGISVQIVRGRCTASGIVVLPEGSGPAPDQVPVVICRAVASLAELGRWSAPLLRGGGELLAMKGESATEELRRDADALGRLGLHGGSVHNLVSPDGSPTTVVRVRKGRVSRET